LSGGGDGEMSLEVEKMVEECRYSEILEKVINDLNPEKVLRLDYYSCYQGHVDIDVLLKDGRVYSYYYSYGSCSGCDEWESEHLSDEIIYEEMKNATYFSNIEHYDRWRGMCNGK
jgi:hypothetical protein